MNIFKIILLPVISLSLVSCTQNLSRRSAKNIIMKEKNAEWYYLIMNGTYNRGLRCYSISSNEISSKDQVKFEQKLTDAGFIKYEMNYFGLNYYSLTNKILPFKYKTDTNFKLAEIDNITIEGISGNADYKQVEFNIIYRPTVIGNLVKDLILLSRKETLSFRKYDDGWRINL